MRPDPMGKDKEEYTKIKSVMEKRRDAGYRIASFVSKILTPQFTTFLAVLILAFLSPIGTGPLLNSLNCFLLGVIFLVVLPISPVLVGYALGKVDIWVSIQTLRTPYFILATITYFIGALIFFYGKSTTMFANALSYALATLSLTIINLEWKISVHSAGVSAPLTALICVFGLVALPVTVLIVAVIWARIKVKAHTTGQSIGGAIIGILITLIVYILVYPIWGPSFL